MIQLTLVGDETRCTLAHTLTRVARRWSALLGDGEHVTTATRATHRRFSEWSGRPLSGREQARVEAYFNAVVRQATMRRRESCGTTARRRLVAATIEADLAEAGWSAERISAEVLRVTGERREAVGAA